MSPSSQRNTVRAIFIVLLLVLAFVGFAASEMLIAWGWIIYGYSGFL